MTTGREVFVPESLAGERLDRALALLTGWSRADVQALVAQGAVRVDGSAAPKSLRLAAGARIEVTHAPSGERSIEPEAIPLVVRYEDPDLVVVAKPAGLVVHPGAGHSRGTLVHGLVARYPEMGSVGDPARPGIVHRLDRETSGLLLVARTQRAYEALVEALGARRVRRIYDVLVWGQLAAPHGVIDAPVGRSVRVRTRMAVRSGGREARTAYDVVTAYDEPAVSRLVCRLETGRTHQIRVHMAAIGHPVVGDTAYGGRRPPLALDRPFLHARWLELDHPVTGAPLVFEEPLPADLAAVLGELGPGH